MATGGPGMGPSESLLADRCLSAFTGQPWSSWADALGRDYPLSDEDETAYLTNVKRLNKTDMGLFGVFPDRDEFVGVLCKDCNAVIKPQGVHHHVKSRHTLANSVPLLPPPSSIPSKGKSKGSSAKHKSKKSSSSHSHSLHKHESRHSRDTSSGNISSSSERQPAHSPPAVLQPIVSLQPLPNQATACRSVPPVTESPSPSKAIGGTVPEGTTLSSSNHSSSSSSSRKRVRSKSDRKCLPIKDREYDPDQHCGVVLGDNPNPCLRSLTCKTHPLSLRRNVTGRSKTFNQLLADHRQANNQAKEAKSTSSSSSLSSFTGSITEKKESSHRDREKERERSKERDKDRERDRESGKERDREREKTRDRDRDRIRDRERDRDRDRDRDRERNHDRDQERDKLRVPPIVVSTVIPVSIPIMRNLQIAQGIDIQSFIPNSTSLQEGISSLKLTQTRTSSSVRSTSSKSSSVKSSSTKSSDRVSSSKSSSHKSSEKTNSSKSSSDKSYSAKSSDKSSKHSGDRSSYSKSSVKSSSEKSSTKSSSSDRSSSNKTSSSSKSQPVKSGSDKSSMKSSSDKGSSSKSSSDKSSSSIKTSSEKLSSSKTSSEKSSSKSSSDKSFSSRSSLEKSSLCLSKSFSEKSSSSKSSSDKQNHSKSDRSSAVRVSSEKSTLKPTSSDRLINKSSSNKLCDKPSKVPAEKLSLSSSRTYNNKSISQSVTASSIISESVSQESSVTASVLATATAYVTATTSNIMSATAALVNAAFATAASVVSMPMTSPSATDINCNTNNLLDAVNLGSDIPVLSIASPSSPLLIINLDSPSTVDSTTSEIVELTPILPWMQTLNTVEDKLINIRTKRKPLRKCVKVNRHSLDYSSSRPKSVLSKLMYARARLNYRRSFKPGEKESSHGNPIIYSINSMLNKNMEQLNYVNAVNEHNQLNSRPSFVNHFNGSNSDNIIPLPNNAFIRNGVVINGIVSEASFDEYFSDDDLSDELSSNENSNNGFDDDYCNKDNDDDGNSTDEDDEDGFKRHRFRINRIIDDECAAEDQNEENGYGYGRYGLKYIRPDFNIESNYMGDMTFLDNNNLTNSMMGNSFMDNDIADNLTTQLESGTLINGIAGDNCVGGDFNLNSVGLNDCSNNNLANDQNSDSQNGGCVDMEIINGIENPDFGALSLENTEIMLNGVINAAAENHIDNSAANNSGSLDTSSMQNGILCNGIPQGDDGNNANVANNNNDATDCIFGDNSLGSSTFDNNSLGDISLGGITLDVSSLDLYLGGSNLGNNTTTETFGTNTDSALFNIPNLTIPEVSEQSISSGCQLPNSNVHCVPNSNSVPIITSESVPQTNRLPTVFTVPATAPRVHGDAPGAFVKGKYVDYPNQRQRSLANPPIPNIRAVKSIVNLENLKRVHPEPIYDILPIKRIKLLKHPQSDIANGMNATYNYPSRRLLILSSVIPRKPPQLSDPLPTYYSTLPQPEEPQVPLEEISLVPQISILREHIPQGCIHQVRIPHASLLQVSRLQDNVSHDCISQDSILQNRIIPQDSRVQDNINVHHECVLRDSVPQDSIPEDSILQDTILNESIPQASIPQDSIQQGSIPQDIIRQDNISQDSIPQDSIPQDSVPQDSVPQDSIPQDSIPQCNTLLNSIPRDIIPQNNIPQGNVPQGNIPQANIPQSNVPQDNILPDTILQHSILQDAILQNSIPQNIEVENNDDNEPSDTFTAALSLIPQVPLDLYDITHNEPNIVAIAESLNNPTESILGLSQSQQHQQQQHDSQIAVDSMNSDSTTQIAMDYLSDNNDPVDILGEVLNSHPQISNTLINQCSSGNLQGHLSGNIPIYQNQSSQIMSNLLIPTGVSPILHDVENDVSGQLSASLLGEDDGSLSNTAALMNGHHSDELQDVVDLFDISMLDGM